MRASLASAEPKATGSKSFIPVPSGNVKSGKNSEPQRKSALAIASDLRIRDACAAAPDPRLRLLLVGGVFLLGEQIAPDNSKFGIAADSPLVGDEISNHQFEQEERMVATENGHAMLMIAAEAQRVSRALLEDSLGCPYTPLELEEMPLVPDLDEQEYVRPASVRLVDAPEPTAREIPASHTVSPNLMDEETFVQGLPRPMSVTHVVRGMRDASAAINSTH